MQICLRGSWTRQKYRRNILSQKLTGKHMWGDVVRTKNMVHRWDGNGVGIMLCQYSQVWQRHSNSKASSSHRPDAVSESISCWGRHTVPAWHVHTSKVQAHGHLLLREICHCPRVYNVRACVPQVSLAAHTCRLCLPPRTLMLVHVERAPRTPDLLQTDTVPAYPVHSC
jgi:hypothetical protein